MIEFEDLRRLYISYVTNMHMHNSQRFIALIVVTHWKLLKLF